MFRDRFTVKELVLYTYTFDVYFVCFYTTQAIEEPFVTAVKEALGDRFTPTMEVIYRKIIRFILTTLTTGFMYYDTDEGNDDSRRSSMMSPTPSVVSARKNWRTTANDCIGHGARYRPNSIVPGQL